MTQDGLLILRYQGGRRESGREGGREGDCERERERERKTETERQREGERGGYIYICIYIYMYREGSGLHTIGCRLVHLNLAVTSKGSGPGQA